MGSGLQLHGNSVSHRVRLYRPCQTPGRGIQGQKMAGHMGAEQVTVQTLLKIRSG